MNNNCSMNEKIRLFDLLSAEKYLAGVYNSDLLESATPEVSSCLWGVLEDEHRIQKEIFEELSARGLYPTEKAPED
ncbi:MAG: spore coat protein, partial [Clostridia bacterium]|nr:spore coat protein [Clostridia bacterium]